MTADPAHRMQPVLSQTLKTDARVRIVPIATPEKFVDRIIEATKICANSRSMPARKTSASQLSHAVNVKVGSLIRCRHPNGQREGREIPLRVNQNSK